MRTSRRAAALVALLPLVAAALACDDGAGLALAPAEAPPLHYPDTRHSPITAEIATAIRARLAAHPELSSAVFAKVGDSITWYRTFLDCLATTPVSDPALEAARARFAATAIDPAGHTSFDRPSLAMHWGWTTSRVLAAADQPLDRELDAIAPGFAVVMLGTNDTHRWNLPHYERDLTAVVDRALARGVTPILSTIPPRRDLDYLARLVPAMNAIVRAVAEKRQVPLVDLWAALQPVAGFGLEADGIHLRSYYLPPYSCVLTPDALGYGGMNHRNLLTLEALDRIDRIVLGDAPPDPAPPALLGDGSRGAPIAVDALPFHDLGRVATTAPTAAPSPTCGTLAGDEQVYAWTAPASLAADQRVLAARAFVDDGVAAEVTIEGDGGCAAGQATSFAGTMAYACARITPGATYHIAVRTAGRVRPASSDAGFRLVLVGHDLCPPS